MNRTRAVVIYALILTLMASMPLLLWTPVPADSKDFINIVLGFFIAKGGDAIGYLLNSTESSKTKDASIAALTSQVASAPNVVPANPPPNKDLDIPTT